MVLSCPCFVILHIIFLKPSSCSYFIIIIIIFLILFLFSVCTHCCSFISNPPILLSFPNKECPSKNHSRITDHRIQKKKTQEIACYNEGCWWQFLIYVLGGKRKTRYKQRSFWKESKNNLKSFWGMFLFTFIF